MEEELDFDDPSFLIELESSTKNNNNKQELTYAQKRQRTITKGLEKGRTNHNKSSRKQLELEIREEGLKTNLISKDLEDGNTSKALKIMKSMGFKPGEALGVQSSTIPVASTSTSTSYGSGIGGGGGIGSRKRSLSPSTIPEVQKPRTEPISFTLREGRKGLGPSLPKSTSFFPSTTSTSSSSTSNPTEEIESYKNRLTSNQDLKKIMKDLKKVTRMCEELDRRAVGSQEEVEENCMWLVEPEEFVGIGKGKGKGKGRRGEYMLEELDYDEDGVRGEGGKSELGYDKGLSNEVVDDEFEELERLSRKKRKDEEREGENEKKEEEREWFSFDAKTRLNLTLNYLRKTYHYCLWCGCQFDDELDMKENCPGEVEEDH